MKAYKKTSEIIDFARLFHIKMKKFYEELNKHSNEQRIKLFLDFLIERETLREKTLADFLQEASGNILNSWFKYIPENIPEDCFKEKVNNPDITLNEIVDYALQLNNCLVEMYKGLMEEADADELKELFHHLWKKIEKEEKNLVRDSELLYDL